MASQRDTSTICIFDVDGTLTAPRLKICPDMDEFLQKLKRKVPVALVGGSDLVKIEEQMTLTKNETVTKKFDYVFSENGLVAYRNGENVGQQDLLKYVGEEKLQKVINFAMKYMSDITLPAKRGTFFEFRSSMINICPVGRSCSQEERLEFAAYDKEHNMRQKFRAALMKEFPDAGLVFAIGGQISIDVYPEGWDKTFCLQFIEEGNYQTIHFFGDKTDPGGNDHEIFSDSRTIGHKVTSPEDTMKQVKELFFKD
ncbi:phosphomannomutase 2-like [Mizuhopecten yessoensis]|uniref:Phosphomannomutase n=1 Tax=Mizuhopecten yessoensis TaxID=6573 RepID=A0A210QWA3_MIZYE|nr:phosphomannomutase 2-like [Mizuhopecten yessoensis]OWF52993.1 Phosphomannomutase 2 [Mizuhopecten yessoensis]